MIPASVSVFPGRPPRTTTLISPWPRPAFSIQLPHGTYEMPPCPTCELHKVSPCSVCRPVSTFTISPRIESSDIGDDRRVSFPVDDLQIAYDLVVMSKDYGVVACVGPVPSKEEIDQAYEQLEAYLQITLKRADMDWAARKMLSNGDHAQIAASYFNVPRNWHDDTAPKDPCPACRAFNPPYAARCSNVACGAVLNWAKARELAILRQDEIELGLALGKLDPIPGIDKPKKDRAN